MAKKEYLVKLGEVNVSAYILADTYECCERDITKTWTDANHRVHASVVAKKVSGRCELLIQNDTDLNTFLDAFENAKSGAYTQMSVYVLNRKDYKQILGIVDAINPTIRKNVSDTRYGKFVLTFEER